MPNKYARNWDDLYAKTEITKTRQIDPRFYSLKFVNGEFSALIRFLPAPGDEAPYVSNYYHSYKGLNGGSYFNEPCPTTIGHKCPVCDSNSEAWKSDNKQLARYRGRRGGGIANILVIQDPQVPDNNGKQFLYRFGAEVMKKIKNTTRPPEDKVKIGIKPIPVFDYYNGANFRLIGKTEIRNDDKNPQRSYEESSFGEVCPIGEDSFIDRLESSLISLQEFVDPSKFKPYDQLRSMFDASMGGAPAPVQQSAPIPASQQPVTTQTQKSVQEMLSQSSTTAASTTAASIAAKVEATEQTAPVVTKEAMSKADFFSALRSKQKKER